MGLGVNKCKQALITVVLLALIVGAVVWKGHVCAGMQSPLFVDEIGYADVAHEIAARGSWMLHYDLPQSFPPWYSAVLSPCFLLHGRFGMDGVYRAFLLLNNMLALVGCAVTAALPWWRTWHQRWSGMLFVSLWPSLYAYQHSLLSENLFIPLFLLSLLVIGHIANRTNQACRAQRLLAVALGVVLAFMYGVRPVAGVVSLVSALLALLAVRQWRPAMLTALVAFISLVAVLAPDFLWGKPTLFHYAGQTRGMITALASACGNWTGFYCFMIRLCYAALYPLTATLMLPLAGIVCSYRHMAQSWRISFLYSSLSLTLIVFGSALHAMASQHCLWTPRYMDPFVVGIVALGLVAMTQVVAVDRWKVITMIAAGCLLIVWVPVETAWWMNALPLAYLRLLRYIHYLAPACGWLVLLVVLSTIGLLWTTHHWRMLAAVLLVLLLVSLDFLNSEEYARHSRVLRSLYDVCRATIGTRRAIAVEKLAGELNVRDPREVALMRQGIYFWTMGGNMLKVTYSHARPLRHHYEQP